MQPSHQVSKHTRASVLSRALEAKDGPVPPERAR
jgi:hypothetical protein